jgi:hypothetical protein
MRGTKRFIVLLLFALAAGAAAFGLHSRAAGPVQVVRDQFLDSDHPDRRMVTLRLGNWTASCDPLRNHVEARVRGHWTGPWELFGGEICVIPAEADACRLLVQVQRRSPCEWASNLFERSGLANRLPKLYDWVACHLPAKRPPAREVTVEIDLSGGAHNFPLHWTGSSRFSLPSMATALAAAPGQ